MEMFANQVTAFIGPSGCGKSTFLRTLNRMNETVRGTRVEGEILLDGVNILEQEVAYVRRRVGMVFQRSNPFPKSIFDNIAYGPRINGMVTGRSRAADKVEQSLRRAALWDEVKDKLNDSAYGLSGGQQQRLCIARALGRGSGSAAARRTVFRARSYRHRENRGPDFPAKEQLHHRDRDAQHAAGRARRRPHRLFPAGPADRIRQHAGHL